MLLILIPIGLILLAIAHLKHSEKMDRDMARLSARYD